MSSMPWRNSSSRRNRGLAGDLVSTMGAKNLGGLCRSSRIVATIVRVRSRRYRGRTDTRERGTATPCGPDRLFLFLDNGIDNVSIIDISILKIAPRASQLVVLESLMRGQSN